MTPKERQASIVDLLRKEGRASVDALADQLSASRETIRRDLTELAGRNRIRKFHGGAMIPELNSEDAFSVRMKDQLREKRAVGRAAAKLFGPNDSILIDAGTTTLIFAEELARQSGLTIVTNCLAIAQVIAQGPGDHRTFLIGGEYQQEVGETLGSLAVAQITKFNAVDAVITIGGLVTTGAYDFLLEETEVARAMIAQARRLTIIADGSKLDRSALFEVCKIEDIDRLVVDRPPDGALHAALVGAGVEIIVAPPLKE